MNRSTVPKLFGRASTLAIGRRVGVLRFGRRLHGVGAPGPVASRSTGARFSAASAPSPSANQSRDRCKILSETREKAREAVAGGGRGDALEGHYLCSAGRSIAPARTAVLACRREPQDAQAATCVVGTWSSNQPPAGERAEPSPGSRRVLLPAYVVLDIFSRSRSAGWTRPENRRWPELRSSKRPYAAAIRASTAPRFSTLAHSEKGGRGVNPRSSTAQLLDELGVTRSEHPCQVFRDNPFSEAQFKAVTPAVAWPFHRHHRRESLHRTFFPLIRHPQTANIASDAGIAMATPDRLHPDHEHRN